MFYPREQLRRNYENSRAGKGIRRGGRRLPTVREEELGLAMRKLVEVVETDAGDPTMDRIADLLDEHDRLRQLLNAREQETALSARKQTGQQIHPSLAKRRPARAGAGEERIPGPVAGRAWIYCRWSGYGRPCGRGSCRFAHRSTARGSQPRLRPSTTTGAGKSSRATYRQALRLLTPSSSAISFAPTRSGVCGMPGLKCATLQRRPLSWP